MGKGRLEAFSDGVIAILITIMVLELKVPAGADLAALRPMLPVFISYVLSFIYLGIYWTNHHHMLHATERIDGPILWANLHLLFWLSLVPFVTNWMGDHFEPLPVAAYGVVLMLAGVAYLHPPPIARPRRSQRQARGGRRARREERRLDLPVCRCHWAGIRQPMDLRRHLCPGRHDVARSRSADRVQDRPRLNGDAVDTDRVQSASWRVAQNVPDTPRTPSKHGASVKHSPDARHGGLTRRQAAS